MQLSTSVLPSDPSIAAALPPGVPGGVPANPPGAIPGTLPGEKPAVFAELLPAAEVPSVPVPKKPTEALPSSAGEGVAAIWAGWLAATAPTPPPPTQVAAWDATSSAPVASDAGVESAENAETPWIGKGGAPTSPVVAGATGKVCRPVVDDHSSAGEPRPTEFVPPPTGSRQNVPLPAAAVSAPEAKSDAAPELPSTATLTDAPPVEFSTRSVAPESFPLPPVAATETVAALVGQPESPRPSDGLRQTPRAIRAAFAPTMGREKIADVAEQNLPLRFQSLDEAEKKILSVTFKEVTKGNESLGIGIAMPGRTMFTNLFTHSSAGTTLVAATVQPQANAGQAAVPSAEMASQAHRAVNVILTVAERAAAASRPTVHLQFAVGGADLSIRVELRAGEVHTTFRTDSGELRSALAAAWQSLDSETNRGLRLADAVFAPATAAGTGASLGDGASAQRDPGSRQTADVFQPTVSRPSFARAEPQTAAPDYREAALLPNLNLYTFA